MDDDTPLSQIIERSPFGIFAVDPSLTIRRTSRGAMRFMAGIDPVRGRPLAEVARKVWKDDFADLFVERFRETLQSGQPFATKSTVARRGRPAQLETIDWRIELVPLADGTPVVVCYFYDITERHKWESALRESESRYRSLLSTLDQGYCLCEIVLRDGKPVDYRFLEANEHFSTATGLHNPVGRTAHELVANLEQQWVEIYARVALEGQTVRFQSESAAMGRIFDVFATPVEPRGRFMIVFSDVTQRLRAEQALRDSEERFRMMADTAPAMLWVTDADHNATFLSRGWYEFTGQTQAEALGLGWTSAVHPDDRQHTAEVFLKAAARREAFGLDYRLRHRDGEYRWAIDEGRPRFDERGAFIGYIGSVIDTHERFLAEGARRESEKRFRLLADNITQFAWITDETGSITWYNQRWFDYTGTTLDEMKGWGWQKVHHPDHLDRVVKHFRQAIAEGDAWQDEFPLRGRDGQYRWFLSRAMPLRDDAGAIVGWFGTNTDVTEIRAATDALQQADRRKDEFLATLAHELRNPLSAIRAGVKVLQVSGDYPAPAAVVATLDRQSMQLARLIEDLLDVHRITRDRLELRCERVPLSAVMHHAIEMIAPAFEAAEHRLHVDLSLDPINLYVDVARLAQAVSNVLHNACRYTPTRGNIWIRTQRLDNMATIIVRDDGIGIPPDQLQRVFDLFSQLDRPVERQSGGLGIGLSLVKRMVELHGGEVQLHSDGEGKGTCVTIRLPIDRSPLHT